MAINRRVFENHARFQYAVAGEDLIEFRLLRELFDFKGATRHSNRLWSSPLVMLSGARLIIDLAGEGIGVDKRPGSMPMGLGFVQLSFQKVQG